MLIVPKRETLDGKTLEILADFIAEEEFAPEWDDAPASAEDLAESLSETTPTRLYSREGTPDTVEKAMALATRANIALAVHIDGTNDAETCEWNHRAYLTWFDPKTGARHEEAAGSMDPSPLIPWDLVVAAAADPASAPGKSLLARNETLAELGIVAGIPFGQKPGNQIGARVDEFDHDASEFRASDRRIGAQIDKAGARITLETGDTEEGENPEVYIEARRDGWALFVHENSYDEPSVRVRIPDNGTPEVQKL